MKNSITTLLIIVMAIVMTIGSTSYAYATESTDLTSIPVTNSTLQSRGNVFPYTSYGNALAITTSSKRLAYSTTGFNCYVTIRCELNGITNKGIVVMKDANGNTIWNSGTTYGVPAHGSYQYWVGSDVYSIWIYTSSGFGSAWVQP